MEIHVTRTTPQTGDVYGHETTHCNANGCNGTEHYFPKLRAAKWLGSSYDGGCVRGAVVELPDPMPASKDDVESFLDAFCPR
jgi:hypothetical protein